MAGIGWGHQDEKKVVNTPIHHLTYGEEKRPTIYGIVTFTIKEAKKLHLSRNAELASNSNVYVKVSIRSTSKRTQIARENMGNPKWQTSFSMPVSVLHQRRHPFNWVKVEVFSFNSNRPSQHRLIGAVSFHLHEIIQCVPVAGAFDLFNNDVYAGELHLGLLFTYGLYGYGYSMQLQRADGQDIKSALKHSLLPRVEPPPERTADDSIIMVASNAPHPDFIPFHQKVDLVTSKNHKKDNKKTESKGRVYENVMKRLTRIKQLKSEFLRVDGRFNKLAWLHQQVLARQDTEETVIATHNDIQDSTPNVVIESHIQKPYMKHFHVASSNKPKSSGFGGFFTKMKSSVFRNMRNNETHKSIFQARMMGVSDSNDSDTDSTFHSDEEDSRSDLELGLNKPALVPVETETSGEILSKPLGPTGRGTVRGAPGALETLAEEPDQLDRSTTITSNGHKVSTTVTISSQDRSDPGLHVYLSDKDSNHSTSDSKGNTLPSQLQSPQSNDLEEIIVNK